MAAFRRSRSYCLSCQNLKLIRSRTQHSLVTQSVLNEEVEYPPVKPRFPPGHEWGDMPSKIAWLWDQAKQNVTQIKTTTGKIDHLTKDRYHTWHFPAVQLQPLALDYQLNIMKTHMAEGLPSLYKDLDISKDIEACKALLIQTISVENEINRDRFTKKRKYKVPEVLVSHTYVKTILNTLYTGLLQRHDHLTVGQMDENVKVQAFWNRHGIMRPLPKDYKGDRSKCLRHNDTRFQAEHDVHFQIRAEKPLPEFYPRDHEMFENLSYPALEYYPKTLGQFSESISHAVSTGAKVGSPCEFTSLSVQMANHHHVRRVREISGEKYSKLSCLGYGIVTSFASAVAQAHYQGFNLHEELTYPFTTQTIVTDGQYYTFYAYQLNTLRLWLDDKANPLKNICWVIGPHKLYDTVEDGEVKGFDDSVLEFLLKFLVLKPEDRGYDLRPNLSKDDAKLGTLVYIPRKKEIVEYEEVIEYTPER